MKEYFITPQGSVVVCSKINMLYRDHEAFHTTVPMDADKKKLFFVSAVLDNDQFRPRMTEFMTMEECDAMTVKLVEDIFELDLPGYPTHGGKPPGGPLEG